MIRTTPARLTVLAVVATGPLAIAWAVAYMAGAGVGVAAVPLVPITLGLAVAVLTVLAAVRLTGHPTDSTHDDGGRAATRTQEPEPVGQSAARDER